VYHLYTIKSARRDALAAHLRDAQVQTAVNYPVALPFLPAYKRYQHSPEDFPNASTNQSQILSIPLFPEMTELQQERVIQAIGDFA
jgi:dTDP-4-amino-4,6-dideoxygalactose transaminase